MLFRHLGICRRQVYAFGVYVVWVYVVRVSGVRFYVVWVYVTVVYICCLGLRHSGLCISFCSQCISRSYSYKLLYNRTQESSIMPLKVLYQLFLIDVFVPVIFQDYVLAWNWIPVRIKMLFTAGSMFHWFCARSIMMDLQCLDT